MTVVFLLLSYAAALETAAVDASGVLSLRTSDETRRDTDPYVFKCDNIDHVNYNKMGCGKCTRQCFGDTPTHFAGSDEILAETAIPAGSDHTYCLNKCDESDECKGIEIDWTGKKCITLKAIPAPRASCNNQCENTQSEQASNCQSNAVCMRKKVDSDIQMYGLGPGSCARENSENRNNRDMPTMTLLLNDNGKQPLEPKRKGLIQSANDVITYRQQCTDMCKSNSQCTSVTYGWRSKKVSADVVEQQEYFCDMFKGPVATQAVTGDSQSTFGETNYKVLRDACILYCHEALVGFNWNGAKPFDCAQCRIEDAKCFVKTTKTHDQLYSQKIYTPVKRGAGMCEGKGEDPLTYLMQTPFNGIDQCMQSCQANDKCTGGYTVDPKQVSGEEKQIKSVCVLLSKINNASPASDRVDSNLAQYPLQASIRGLAKSMLGNSEKLCDLSDSTSCHRSNTACACDKNLDKYSECPAGTGCLSKACCEPCRKCIDALTKPTNICFSKTLQ